MLHTSITDALRWGVAVAMNSRLEGFDCNDD